MKLKNQVKTLRLLFGVAVVVGMVGWFLPTRSEKPLPPYLTAGSLIQYTFDGDLTKMGVYRVTQDLKIEPMWGTMFYAERYEDWGPDYCAFRTDWFSWFHEDVKVLYRAPEKNP